MKPEDYIKLHDLLWERIMHLGLKKIDFEPIQNSFSELGESTGYNIVQLILERLAKGDNVQSAMAYVRNTILQAGYVVEESYLHKITEEVNDKNQDEIMAVQVLWEMIDNRESWETTCMTVEITLLPEEY